MIAGVNYLAHKIDLPMLVGVIAVCSVGLGILYSAGGEDIELVYRQIVRIVIAVAFMLFFALLNNEQLSRISPIFYVLGVGLLVFVLVAGTVGRGAQRWIDLGFLKFQPAELMKIAVPMMIAWLLTRNPLFRNGFYYVIGLVLAMVPAYLVYEQPDLGTAFLIAVSGIVAICLGGLAWRWIIAMGLLVVTSIPILWPFLHSYQQARVLSLLNPWSDPLGSGYHTIQSTIAIGSGGLVGKGWLNGSQSQLEFIPERQTDFAFSVFAEEFGIIGSAILILLYLFVILRCLVIAYQSKSRYIQIVGGSIGVILFLHVFVNIGMVSGILPVVGVPLPLISYGGTSMVALLAGIGIVMGARGRYD